MSGCKNAVEHLYEYIDTELTWWQATRVKWHLRRCKPCTTAFDFEQHLKSVIREKGGNDVIPPELLDRLRALIHEEGNEQAGA